MSKISRWNWCTIRNPLQREADMLAQAMPADMPLRQRRWLGLQMLEGDIYSRAFAGNAADKLDLALANLSGEMDDPALYIADARYQSIAAVCDAVSNTLTAEPSRFTTAMDKIILNRFLGFANILVCDVPDVPAGYQHRRRPAADFSTPARWLSSSTAFSGWATLCTSRTG